MFEETSKEMIEKVTSLLKEYYDKGFTAGKYIGLDKGFQLGRQSYLKDRREDDRDYKDGLDDGSMAAWDCARKIVIREELGGIGREAIKEIFNTIFKEEVFRHYSAPEALAKIREWEDSKTKAAEESEIEAFDELIDEDGDKVVCLSIVHNSPTDYCDSYIYLVHGDGSCGKQVFERQNYRKTGRKFLQLAEVLNKINEGRD